MRDIFFEMVVKSPASEILKEFVFELGVQGLEEIEGGFIIRDEENLENLEFALIQYKNSLEETLNLDINLEISISEKENIDWINEYKKSVKAIEVGRFYVRPSWEKPKENSIDLVIDPALAFGSGHHESTNMCLNLISKYAKPGNLALDVGCGSGILSIALKKLGCRVCACDTDEQAVDSSKDNALKNSVELDKIWLGSVEKNSDKYDIVVANIIADVILILQNELKDSLKSGGVLILSGILEKYFDRIKSTFDDLNLIETSQKGEWMSFVFKKG